MTKIIAVTACPSGVAHTYMAAEALESAAKAKGWEVKVETQGSIGLENELTARTIASKNNEIQITFMQTLRTVDGHVISYSEYRMPARDMTPIEAALYVAAKVKPSI